MTDTEHALRREGDRELPIGPKARRTREAILAAAYERFGTYGYQRTTVADVAEAAGVSVGTVYQYFRDRSDLVAALVRRAVRVIAAGEPAFSWASGRAGLERVIGNFVTSYAGWSEMARVWEEVSHIDDELAELRRAIGRTFTESVEQELRRAARNGDFDPAVDPALAARALTSMVDRYCYVTYVFDPPEDGVPTPAASTEVLAKLWAAAIGL
jgi:AcrR family transcriptional regulator